MNAPILANKVAPFFSDVVSPIPPCPIETAPKFAN
jgi:hypothetical protein